MRSRVAIALAVASVLLSTASPALARCMVFGGRYARIGSGDVSASAPAIVLGLATDYHVRDGEPVPTRLRLGGHALTVETLAPGLVVARSSSAIHIGTLPLRGLATRISVTLAARTQGVALAAPDVASIGLDSMQHEARAMAELRTPSPAGAIAVVVAQGGTPIAWAPVDAPSAGVEVAHESLCGVFDPEGYRFPSAGDVVTLAWVDAAGRLSQPSSPITVRSLEPRSP